MATLDLRRACFLSTFFALVACVDDVDASGGGTGGSDTTASATNSEVTSTAPNPSADDTSAGTTVTGGTQETGGTAVASTSSGVGSGSSAESGKEESGSEDSGSTDTGGGTTCEQVACVGDTLWSRRFGDTMAGYVELTDLKAHELGTYIAGTFNPEVDFGEAGLLEINNPEVIFPSPRGAFVAKLDAEGEPVWATAVRASNFLEVGGLAQDAAGNLAIVGIVGGALQVGGETLTGNGDASAVFVVTLAEDGEIQHSARFGYGIEGTENTNRPVDIAMHTDGTFSIIGSFDNPVSFGGNLLTPSSNDANDVFVAVFESDGEHRWSRRFGDSAEQRGTGVALTDEGDVLVVGTNTNVIDFGGEALGAPGAARPFVACLDAVDGAHVWSREFVLDQYAVAKQAVAHGGGITYVGLNSRDASLDVGDGEPVLEGSLFVVALDNAGTALWGRAFEGDFYGVMGELAIDPDSSVVVVGAFNGIADFGEGDVASLGPFVNQMGRDVFATKLDIDGGATIWSRQVGDSNQQFAEQVALGVGVDPNGNVWVGGTFEGVFNWGDGEITASGGYSTPDGFVAKLSP